MIEICIEEKSNISNQLYIYFKCKKYMVSCLNTKQIATAAGVILMRVLKLFYFFFLSLLYACDMRYQDSVFALLKDLCVQITRTYVADKFCIFRF